MRVGEVQMDGGGTEAVMAEDLLNGGRRDAFLKRHRGEHMPQHVRRHVLGDAGALGDTFNDFLYLAGFRCRLATHQSIRALRVKRPEPDEIVRCQIKCD